MIMESKGQRDPTELRRFDLRQKAEERLRTTNLKPHESHD